jgi:hypothetical protein
MITRLPPQTDPPLPPRETLPTMYDLPNEDLEEPGLPDVFHDLPNEALQLAIEELTRDCCRGEAFGKILDGLTRSTTTKCFALTKTMQLFFNKPLVKCKLKQCFKTIELLHSASSL